MFVSYENNEIRNCCLLLRPASMDSSFSTDEIKEIRSIIADLKATPKLIDSPIKYKVDRELSIVYIEYGVFNIVCRIISSHVKPTDEQIQRIKIIKIINVGLQMDSTKKHNFK